MGSGFAAIEKTEVVVIVETVTRKVLNVLTVLIVVEVLVKTETAVHWRCG